MIDIKKISNINSSNYEVDNARLQDPYSVIRYIVIGMTNSTHSGTAYANSYKKALPSPVNSFNYVIDKNGSIFQTIEDKYVPYSIRTRGSDEMSDNVDVLSICLMPTWEGSGYGDEYDRYNQFPSYPDDGDEFILTKAKNIKGEEYPIGLYEYDGSEWQLIEEMTSEEVKRPYNSSNWYIEEETEESCLHLVNWLKAKYNINDARVLRVYDFNKLYSPAPYVIDGGSSWQGFKDDLDEIDGQVERYRITTKVDVDVSQEIQETHPNMSVAEIIEKFGPAANSYDYKCTRQDTCPYRGVVMFDNLCTLAGISDELSSSIINCPYRQIQLGKKGFVDNAVVDVTLPRPSNFTFRMGMHNRKDTLWTIHEAVDKLQYSSYLNGSIGELTFNMRNKNNLIPVKEGFNVGYWVSEVAGFNGNVFEIEQRMSEKEMLGITCYGNMKYLQADGFRSFTGKTASQIFSEICLMLGLGFRVIDESTYVCTSKNCYGDSWYSAIENAIVETMAMTGKWYIVQENFGILEFRDIINADNVKQIKFSEDSCIIDGSFTTNITDSYNCVIGYIAGDGGGSNGQVSVAAHAEARDASTINEWGLLTKVEEVNKNNTGSLQDWVNKRLRYYNSPRRRFKLSCIGVPGIMAGNIIWLEIYNVISVGNIVGGVVVDKCTHKIEKNKHTMDLEVEIVQDGTIMADITSAIQKIKEANKEIMVNGL